MLKHCTKIMLVKSVFSPSYFVIQISYSINFLIDFYIIMENGSRNLIDYQTMLNLLKVYDHCLMAKIF